MSVHDCMCFCGFVVLVFGGIAGLAVLMQREGEEVSIDKEWEVEATIEIRTSFYCDTREEAEKEAHKYLSELCQSLYPDCCSNSYEIENIYSYTED